MRLLLIEDDPALGDGLCTGLTQDGFTVDWLADGDTARGALERDDFDAVILDLRLPGRSGVDLLREWRAEGVATPVLVLSAYDAVSNRIDGLDSGADDFMPKPADLGEIAARVRALARRAGGQADNAMVCGGLRLDRASHHVTLDGRALHLSARELSLLEALLERPDRIVSRDHLEARLYGWGDGPESNSLEVHIHHLRRQLGAERIVTERGLGYRLVDPER